MRYHRAFLWEAPYGLAYNYTIASITRSLHNRRNSAPLLQRSSLKAFRAEKRQPPQPQLISEEQRGVGTRAKRPG